MLWYLLLIAVSAPLDVQTSTLIQAKTQDDDVKLPRIASKDVIADRINAYLFMTMIGEPPATDTTFAETDTTEHYASLDFKVIRNDEHVFAVRFESENCGAYCEDFSRELTFDATTGRTIRREDVLTKKGRALLAKRASAERIKQWRARMTQLSKLKKRDDDADAALAMYTTCVAEERERAYDLTLDLSYGATGLTATSERCSNHAMRALDDVDQVSVTIAWAELDLTPYGKALLTGGPSAPAPASPLDQVLHGTVGNAAITLVLDTSSGNAHYFYDKFRKSIALSVNTNAGNVIELAEGDSATFKLGIHGAALTGEWVGKDRSLKVELH